MTSISWYRRRCWQLKGKREYTKSGFEYASGNFNQDDLDVDCSDSHFLITGANSGLGLQTALDIARRGGILHLVCRNRASMTEARSHIITTTGNDKIHMHTLDLSRPRDVCRWAHDFATSHEKLDVLINNAGTINLERQTDEDGIEATFAVHCLSPHILIFTLLPLLQRSDDPRIITVSSAGMLKVKLDPYDLLFEKMDPYDGLLAHSQTKRQQVVLNLIYAQMHESVRFYCAHPGWVDTPTLRSCLPEFYDEMKDNLRTTSQGADTIVWLAVSQAALKHSSGLFFQDRFPISTHLPLAWTRHTLKDEQLLFKKLNCLLLRVSPNETTSAIENASYGYSNYLKTKLSSPPKSECDSLVENESIDSLTSTSKDHNSVNSQRSEDLDFKKGGHLIYSDSFEEDAGRRILMGVPEDNYNGMVASFPEGVEYSSQSNLENSPFESEDGDLNELEQSSPDLDPSPMQVYLRDRLESIPEMPDEQSLDSSDCNLQRTRTPSKETVEEDPGLILDSQRRPVIIPYLTGADPSSNKERVKISVQVSPPLDSDVLEEDTDSIEDVFPAKDINRLGSNSKSTANEVPPSLSHSVTELNESLEKDLKDNDRQ